MLPENEESVIESKIPEKMISKWLKVAKGGGFVGGGGRVRGCKRWDAGGMEWGGIACLRVEGREEEETAGELGEEGNRRGGVGSEAAADSCGAGEILEMQCTADLSSDVPYSYPLFSVSRTCT